MFNIALVKKIQIRKNDHPLPTTLPVEKFAQVDLMARICRPSHPLISHEPIWPDRIHLQDVEGDITGNEKYILAKQRATYRTEQYYHIRWNQSMDQLAQLNWKVYTKNYERSLLAPKKFVIKMMTGWLPVNHQVNKMLNTPISCHLCHQEETIPHLFRCDSRAEWRSTFLQTSHEKLCSLHTPQELQHIIIQHLKELLKPTPPHTHFRHFTIFAVLLPLHWQPSDATQNLPTSFRGPNQWSLSISKWFTQQGNNLWKLRNKQVHDDQEETVADHLLNQKIEKLYRLQDELSHYDKNIFQQPIEEKYRLTNKQKIEWIDQTTQTVYKCIADHHKNMTHGQRDIRQYFTQKKEDR